MVHRRSRYAAPACFASIRLIVGLSRLKGPASRLIVAAQRLIAADTPESSEPATSEADNPPDGRAALGARSRHQATTSDSPIVSAETTIKIE